MDIAGWNAVFGNGHVHFFNKDKIEVFDGILKNGLYLVHGSFNTSIPAALTARSLQRPTDMDTWHRRFAHFGVSRISDATKLVNGLDVVKKDSAGQCEDCIVANMKRRPFDDELIPEKVPLRRTNIDIWGPSHVASEGGALYAMKFHDSGTSHCRSFFLKDRLAITTLGVRQCSGIQKRSMGHFLQRERNHSYPNRSLFIRLQWYRRTLNWYLDGCGPSDVERQPFTGEMVG